MIGSRDEVIEWLTQQNEDTTFDCDEHKEKRSLKANNYFHLLCGKIAGKTLETTTEVKNKLLVEYGEVDIDMPEIILRDDIDWTKISNLHLWPTGRTKILDNGKKYRCYLHAKASHTMNSVQMAKLIDGAIETAVDAGIDKNSLLTPDEKAKMLASWKSRYG